MPKDSANVMQRPGVADTKKNVGTNRLNKLNLINLVSRADGLVSSCHNKYPSTFILAFVCLLFIQKRSSEIN